MNANVNEMVLSPFANSPVVAAPTGASAAAMIQREISEVQAAMLIARKFPRDPSASMDRILMAFTRPSLAEDALYSYARGGQDVSGLSIRAAEELGRQWGNLDCGVYELSRQAGQSEIMTFAMDLETGYRDSKRFMVRHWRDTRTGGHAVKDERDIYEVIANQGARRKRACILAIIPIDVQEAAIKQIELTLAKNQQAVTPELIKSMIERFNAYGVTAAMIEKKIQRRLESITPQGMIQMKKIYSSLKDKMSSPSDWFEMPVDAGAGEPTTTAKTATDTVKDKLRPSAGSTAKAAAADEKIPHYDAAGAMKALREAGSPKDLDDAWKEIVADFRDTERPLPPELEPIYNERTEVMEQNL